LSSLGETLYFQGKTEESQQHCQEALAIFRELGHLTNIGLALYFLGHIEEARNPNKALEYFDAAIETFELAGDFANVSRIFIARGDMHYGRCDFTNAKADFEHAASIFRDRGQDPDPYTQLSLGEAAAALYEAESATRYVDAALAIFDSTRKLKHGIIHCELTYGDIKMIAEEPAGLEGAEALYHNALKASRAVGYIVEQAMCLARLGLVETRRGKYADALHFLCAPMRLFDRGSNLRGKANVLVRIGNVFAKNGETETAVAVYRAAYPVCVRLESRRDEAACLCGLGEILRSRRHLVEAERLYSRTGDVKGKARAGGLLDQL
jgi:tetratricopeptide (TPR) repeat protein